MASCFLLVENPKRTSVGSISQNQPGNYNYSHAIANIPWLQHNSLQREC